MKACSISLEVEVRLNSEELKNSFIKGSLYFMEYDDEGKREIPITIVYNPLQDDPLYTKIIPKVYPWEAEKIIFSISEHFYDRLVASGAYGGRFSGLGKLLIFAENIK